MCGIVTVIGYLPWLHYLLAQFSSTTENFWISTITFKDVISWIDFAFGGSIMKLFAIAAGLIFIFTNGFSVLKDKNNSVNKIEISYETGKPVSEKSDNAHILFYICHLSFWGTIAVGLVLSFLFRPLFLTRYVFVVVGVLWLAISISFSKLDNIPLVMKYILIGIYFICGMSIFIPQYSAERIAAQETESTLAFFEDNLSADDSFVSDINALSGYKPRNMLEYFYEGHDVESYVNYDWKNGSDTVWLLLESEIQDTKTEELQTKYGYSVEKIREGTFGAYKYHLYAAQK